MNYQAGEIIDRYVRPDTSDLFTELQRRLRIGKARYEGIVKKHFGIYDDGLCFRVELAEKLNFDLEYAFTQILQKKKIDREEITVIITLFELAIDTIEEEIDIFEAIVAGGLFKVMTPFFKMFPFRELDAELTIYQQLMMTLKEKLEIAKREKTQAYIDKGVDVLGLALEIIPQFKVAKTALRFFQSSPVKVGIAVGSLVADKYLGPQQPDASKIVRTGSFTFFGELSELKKFSSATKSIIGFGSVLSSAHDTFNFDEIHQADENIRAIQKALKEQKTIHEKIVKGIWGQWEVRVWVVQREMEKANQSLEDSKSENYELRRVLYDEVARANYRNPKLWRILP